MITSKRLTTFLLFIFICVCLFMYKPVAANAQQLDVSDDVSDTQVDIQTDIQPDTHTDNSTDIQSVYPAEPVKEWRRINNLWYYYIDDIMQTGWINEVSVVNNIDVEKWYYLDNNGVMVTGWKKINNLWYFFKPNGLRATQEWLKSGDNWYYLDQDGIMVTGFKQINKITYYFKSSGAMASNEWQRVNGIWYYFKSNGSMAASEWFLYNGKWYYLDDNGAMITGFKQIRGINYYFNKNGSMASGEWLLINGTWYYFKSNGSMSASEWFLYNGKWYYFDNTGAMVKGFQNIKGIDYFFKSNGAMASSEWQRINRMWYYFNTNGSMAKGWLKSGNSWYYLDNDGIMLTGWLTLGNVQYYLKANGAMASNEWLDIGGLLYYFLPNGALDTSVVDTPGLSKTQEIFVDRYHDIAQRLSIQYGIPWEAVMAQGILESAAGTSNFAVNRNNFFGIGAVDSNPGNAYFYDTPEKGWEGYYLFILNNNRYYRLGNVFLEPNVTNPYSYIAGIKAAGYATDPNYVAKLTPLITAVITRAEQRGWMTSAQLAVAYPEMLANAAENARFCAAKLAGTNANNPLMMVA